MHAENEYRRRYSALREICRAYALVVLGLTFALLYFAGLMPPMPSWASVLVHALSMSAVAIGAWLWWKMPPLTASWLRSTHQFALAAMLQVYMVPFLFWWRQMPHIGFFTANAVAALAGMAWLLVQLCDVVAETGRILGDRTLRLEGQVAAWLCPLLLLLPPAHGLVYSLVFYLNAGLPPVFDPARLILIWPEWIRVATALSPILALAVAVEARLRLLGAIRLLKSAPQGSLP